MRRQRGFTILEAMIAIALVLIGVLAITQMQTRQVSAGGQSRQRIEGAMFAQQVIEGLRAFSSVPAASGATAYADIASGSDTVTGAGTSYARSWTVETKASPAHKVVAVTVSWTASGAKDSVSLTTIIAPVDPAVSGQLISGL